MENNNMAHRTSCQYSTNLSKQFITLASAGIAFIAGLVISSKTGPTYIQTIVIFSFFGLSITCGLLFLMHVIGHINKLDNHDVYTPSLRLLGSFQIILFIIGVIVLSYATIIIAKNKLPTSTETPETFLEIKIDKKEIKQPIFFGSVIKLEISKDDDIKLIMSPEDEFQKTLP